MSERGKQRRQKGAEHTNYAQDSEGISLPPDNPVILMFKQISCHLTDRHDRHERLVKLSRDITIESKRVIFLLHSCMGKEDREKGMEEAKERLGTLIAGPLKLIGLELHNRPDYLHCRASSPGFQEFVEAYTFYSVLNDATIPTCDDIQSEMIYTETNDEGEEKTFMTVMTQRDYMLGLADLTGELMRRNIHCITSGEIGDGELTFEVIQMLHTGFLGLVWTSKELHRKFSTTSANTAKAESAMFGVQVRNVESVPSKPFMPMFDTAFHFEDDQSADY